MHGYRVFLIRPDGQIKDRVEFFCENEGQAKERAKQLVDGHAVELWDEGRKIANFEPE
jgi:hypothetical protein